jgi:DNA-binding NarL/FixJ family response regulator
MLQTLCTTSLLVWLGLAAELGGFEAMAAYSSEMGVELARNRDFEILVTDVVMGSKNGIQAAIEICKLIPKCKILLLSGTDATAPLLEDAQSGGHEFQILTKPVHPSVIIDTLRSLTAASTSTWIVP